MTQEEYKNDHIPHRINLLITYRERFKNLSPDKRKNVRDFERCAKDISMLMVRFFLLEFGIGLGKGEDKLSKRKNLNYAKRLPLNDVINNPLHKNILEVLKAANRAVAHIEQVDVNHKFKTELDDERLFGVISYIENKTKSLIYDSDQEFEKAMKRECNNMYRERLKL